jgi:uncharacterized protein
MRNMKQVLKRIISDFNETPLPAFHPRDLQVPLDLEKIVTIVGPRRAGKTWYFYQLISILEDKGVQRRQIVYINFEDERLEIEGGYDQIIDAFVELNPEQALGEIYIFFDEIQELPNWEKYVRRLYDTVTRKIFLTGSNAKMLSAEIATSLRGRSLSFEIMPLSFKEYLSFKGIDTQDRFSTRNRAIIKNNFDEYLLWGGYPELVTVDRQFKPDILQEYFNVMLYRDLIQRYDIKDVSLLKYLIKRLIGSFTKEFSVHKLYNDLKSRGFATSKDSIYRIMDHIFSIYMVASLEKYDPAVVKREMSNRKIYLFDNGFASATQYAFFDDRGKLAENMVFSSLRTTSDEIFFLKNGWECDFVSFRRGERPLLVQVTEKLHQDNYEREITGLLKAKNRIEDGTGLILVAELSTRKEKRPEWIRIMDISDWMLEL